jgi:polysaccharide biosynthesis protein PslH
MPKLLSIVWYKILPAMFGGQKGIAEFNSAISKHVELICLCSKDNEHDIKLPYRVRAELPLSKKQFADPKCHNQILKVAREEAPAAIIIEHPYHGLAAIRASEKLKTKIIVHSHNIESQRFRMLNKWWWRVLFRYERWVHQKADLSLFKTEDDMRFAMKRYQISPEKCLIVPYGITRKNINSDAAQLIRKRHQISDQEKILLFAGTLDYKPNASAVENIFSHIAPGLDATGMKYRILVCGRNKRNNFSYLKKLNHPSIMNLGEVDDIDEYLAAADLFINPVQESAGIQTKNIDAVAQNCTVVCFPQSTTGIPIDPWSQKILVAQRGNWDNFVQMIQLGLQSRTSTPEIFYQFFDWQEVIKPFIAHLQHWDNSLNRSTQ